jgi:hypothetical protein
VQKTFHISFRKSPRSEIKEADSASSDYETPSFETEYPYPEEMRGYSPRMQRRAGKVSPLSKVL